MFVLRRVTYVFGAEAAVGIRLAHVTAPQRGEVDRRYSASKMVLPSCFLSASRGLKK